MSKQLERAAIKAHKVGQDWETFWQRHEADIRNAQPWNRQAYHKLVRRLLGLVVSGDLDGQHPAGDPDVMPWERDAAIEQHGNAVGLQLSLPGMEAST